MARVAVIAAGLLGLVLLAARWSGGGADQPADFVFINRGEVNTLDPNRMSWLQDIRMAYALWEGLYSLDPQKLTPVPGCAERIDLSADQTVYTFHIRPTARWSNGDPVQAGDFVFSWRRMLDEAGDYTDLFHYIRGAKEYRAAVEAGQNPDFATVGVEALDAQTLRVTLLHPVTFFPDLCAFPPFFPLHERSMQAFLRDPANRRMGYRPEFTHPGNLVTNGPYRLAAWEFHRRMRLEASAVYWDRAHVKSAVIQSLSFDDPQAAFLKYETGQVDWLADVSDEIAPDLLAACRKDFHVFPGFGTYFYSVNCQPVLPDGRKNPFADVRVRQAFAMSLDKAPIITSIKRLGQPVATTFIPPDAFAGYVLPKGLVYDPARRALLSDAGYPNGQGFPQVSLLFNTDGDHKNLAQAVRRQWVDALHVEVALEGVEINQFRSRLHQKNYSLARANWIGDYNDPSTFTDKYRTQSENNDSAWSNARYDALCDQAARATDVPRRLDLLRQAEQILCDEAPIIPLYHQVNTYMLRANVHGLPLDPRDMVIFKSVEVVR